MSEAWLCYQAPEPGARSEARYCHKRCVEAGTQVRLLRADFGLHRLLESLLTPAITRALRKDLPGARRPWGSP